MNDDKIIHVICPNCGSTNVIRKKCYKINDIKTESIDEHYKINMTKKSLTDNYLIDIYGIIPPIQIIYQCECCNYTKIFW